MAKQANNKAENKPTADKQQQKKPAQKAVKPKKQPANVANKKEEKPTTTAKQLNQKRKREENGSSVHDADKKMKESPEAAKVQSNLWFIRFANVPETATVQEISELFKDFEKNPLIRLVSFRNKERAGIANASFKNEEDYNKALGMDFTIQGQQLLIQPKLNESRTVVIPYFPGSFDTSDIYKFFEGLEVTNIQYNTTSSGKVTGTVFVEFVDEQTKEAALQKHQTKYNEKLVGVKELDPNHHSKPRVARKVRTQTKTAAKPEKMDVTDEKKGKAAPQKQKPAAKKPNQSKAAPAKKPNQNKAAPAKKPNQNKAAPAKKPNQNKPAQGKKTAAPKPGAKAQKSPAVKAQKKN